MKPNSPQSRIKQDLRGLLHYSTKEFGKGKEFFRAEAQGREVDRERSASPARFKGGVKERRWIAVYSYPGSSPRLVGAGSFTKRNDGCRDMAFGLSDRKM
jgi:hypothetical protein